MTFSKKKIKFKEEKEKEKEEEKAQKESNQTSKLDDSAHSQKEKEREKERESKRENRQWFGPEPGASALSENLMQMQILGTITDQLDEKVRDLVHTTRSSQALQVILLRVRIPGP